jgi:hypothetical protein
MCVCAVRMYRYKYMYICMQVRTVSQDMTKNFRRLLLGYFGSRVLCQEGPISQL